MNLIQVYFSLILLAISAKHYLGRFPPRALLNVFIPFYDVPVETSSGETDVRPRIGGLGEGLVLNTRSCRGSFLI